MTGLQIDRPQRKVSNWISGGLVIALLIGAVVMGFLETQTDIASGVAAPAFEFERFTGGKLVSTDLKGKVVMLDFWATWCPPCVEEMPMLVRVAKEYEGQGVVFIAASQDDLDTAPDDVGAFVKQKLPDLGQFAAYGNPETAARYKIQVLPTMYILDRDGKIIGSQLGPVSERRVRSWLDRALLGKP